MKIEISNNLKVRLKEINDKVSKFLLGNLEVSQENLKDNYPQYLDFDGNLVTYINSNSSSLGNKNPWDSNTRQATKAVRVIRRIYKENFISKNLTQRDIENFVSSWNASQDKSSKVVVYKGWDILKAFNYSGDIDLRKFQTSCANFKQAEAKKMGKSSWDEPMPKWFYFYIYNQGISVVVVLEDGIIRSRSVIFSGQQIENNRDYKEGETYTFLNNIYSEGQEKYKHIILEWAKERGYYFKSGDRLKNLKTGDFLNGNFKLTGFKLHYKTYCPVDGLYGNIREKYITNQYEAGVASLYKFRQNGGMFRGKNVQG